jgi:D-alanine-D-alanine ligase
MKTILLVCWGMTHEHEISVRSAQFIYDNLVIAGYTVVLVWISKTNQRYALDRNDLKNTVISDWTGENVELCPWKQSIKIKGLSTSIDILFPINHWQTWEDWVIQWVSTILGVPCVWPWILSSVQCFHKHLTKMILESNGIVVAPGLVIYKDQETIEYSTVTLLLWAIVFVKPSAAWSSIWVSKVTTSDEYGKALQMAFEVDDVVLIESAIEWREIEFAVAWSWEEMVISVPGEIRTSGRYSYEEKYNDSSTTECAVVEDIDQETLNRCLGIVRKSYQVLWCRWLSRVDGFLTPEGGFIINEINTLPWFTSISMYPKLMEASWVTAPELMKKLIESV